MDELTHKPPIAIKTPSTPGRTLVLIFGALLIVGLISVFGWKLFDSSQTLTIDSPPPDFTLSLFEGGQLTLSELRGQVVLVNFWASWCVPCRAEAPVLERAWRRYHDRGVLFIGIDYLDTDKPAQAFLEEFGITYPNGPDVGTKNQNAPIALAAWQRLELLDEYDEQHLATFIETWRGRAPENVP